jgi:hypothetical protein
VPKVRNSERGSMADSEENRQRVAAAERLSRILENHGVARARRGAPAFTFIGILIGGAIGLLIGWVIWG